MLNQNQMEKRIQVIEDVEAIKKLKAKYFNSIDRKCWNELAECFCEDAVWESIKRKVKIDGAEAIVKFITSIDDGDHIINAHQGHNPAIEITSADTAKGLWELSHYREDKKEKYQEQSAAFYEDIYIKDNGTWKIKSSKIIPLYLNKTVTAK